MADISKLSRLLNGVQRNVDLSSNALVVGSLKVGSVSPTELTKTILDRLVSLQNGTDVDATYHTHDGRYYTESELAAATGTTGSDLIGDDDTYSQFTPAAATAKGAFSGIDAEMAEFIRRDGSVPFTANQPMGGFKLTGLAAGTGAGDSVRYEQAILITGVNAFTADQSMGSFKLTNVATPVSGTDAANKAYVDAVVQGLKPKQAVRAASTANVVIASALENGDTLDGVTLATGDRVLLKDQTDATENGIYIVAASGAASRSPDFDSLSPIDEINGAYTFIQEGTQAGQGWVQTGLVTAIGTDDINFVYFNAVGTVIGGDMITVTGSTISVDLATVSGLESTNPGNDAGQLRIKLEASNPTLRITGSNELAAKLDAAGAIITGASGLAVQVDGSTLEINSNTIRVKAAGINENHLATSVAGGGLTGGAGSALAVGAGNGIQVNANDVEVIHSPKTLKSMVAGESMAANTSFLVRFAVNGETAGRVYKADKDASVSNLYNAVGVALSTGAVSAGGSVNVTVEGTHILGASDTPFAGTDIGKAVYLLASGAFSVTAPTATDEAAFQIGIVENTDRIWVGNKQLHGIN